MQKDGMEDAASSKPNEAGLEFVLVEHPTKRASGDVRKRVRSHVTKLQHQRNREKEIESHTSTARPFIPYSSENVKQKGAPKRSAKVAKVRKPKNTASDRGPTERALTKHYHSTVLQIRSPKREDDGQEVEELPRSQFWTDFGPVSHNDLDLAFSRGTMSFRTFALDDSTNTVGSSLEALGLDVASVLGCYKLIAQIQSRDFESNYPNIMPNVVVWERFYKFVFTDPVLLTVALLLTIRYRLECLGYRNRSKDFMQVLQLEDFLIKRVNTALKDPVRAVSDPMLVAVALCAAYEVKNGNPEAYHIHMKGLLRMIDLRGGLAAIGNDDPYLERMLIWHDVNTAKIIGHDGYLLHLPNSTRDARPKSNLLTFRTPIEAEAESESSRSRASSEGT